MTIELLPGLAGDKALSYNLCYPLSKLRGLVTWYLPAGIVVFGGEKNLAASSLSDKGRLSQIGEAHEVGMLLTSDL